MTATITYTDGLTLPRIALTLPKALLVVGPITLVTSLGAPWLGFR
jgi:hypothetical protein